MKKSQYISLLVGLVASLCVWTLHAALLANVTNTGLALGANGHIAGPVNNRLAFLYEGTLDINNDGRIDELLLHVYEETTGAITFVGTSNDDYVIFGDYLAFRMPEKFVNIDLNGDGDMVDSVMHVHNAATGVTTNTGLAASGRGHIDGDWLAIKVRENGQGLTDLNSDGDTSDSVPHLYQISTGAITNLGVSSYNLPQVVDENFVVFITAEFQEGNTDLNGNGTTSDSSIYHYYNISTGVMTNTGLRVDYSTNQTPIILAVPETVSGDLNGDGDATDQVAQTLDLNTGIITNTGLSGVITQAYIVVREEWQGNTDLNGDGDALDQVLYLYDTVSGSFGSTGLSIGENVLQNENILAFDVVEAEQGNVDLNGDGDTADNVLHYLDIGTGLVTNAGVAAANIRKPIGNLIPYISPEFFDNTDLNGDGDALDEIQLFYDISNNSVVNYGIAGRLGNVESGFATISMDELPQGNTDLNGDGDVLDESVAHVLNLNTGEIVNLGLDGNAYMIGTHALVAVQEEAQGNSDLNMDGDALDRVLHIVDIVENKPPIASNIAAQIIENAQSIIAMEATDPEDDPLTYIQESSPSQTLAFLFNYPVSGNALYYSSATFTGTDNFTYKVNDGHQDSNTATVTVSSLGSLLDAGDQTLTVTDLPGPDGVQVVASSSGGPTPAQFSMCNLFTIDVAAGADFTVACGSAIVEVLEGVITVSFLVDGDELQVELDAGDAVTIDESGTITNDGSGTAEVVINGAPAVIEEGQTVNIIDSDGDGISDSADACPEEDASGFDTDNDGCIDSISGLLDLVSTLVSEGVITSVMENSLLSKVANAQSSFDKENVCAAMNQLDSFNQQIEAQTGKKISAEAATHVMSYSNSVSGYLSMQLVASGDFCS